MKENLEKIFSEEILNLLIGDIVLFLSEKIKAKDVKFSFNIYNGNMISKPINTKIYFSSEIGNHIFKFFKDLKDFFINTNISEEEAELVFIKKEEFETKIKNKLNDYFKNLYISSGVRDRIRKLIFGQGNKVKETFPMETIKSMEFYINPVFDIENDGFIIRIQKTKDEFSNNKVIEELNRIHKESKKSIDEILKEKKEIKDPLFKNVVKASKSIIDNEFYLSLWIDFSPKK